MSENIVVKIENLSKIYKIFNKPIDRLKESLNPLKKRYSKDFYALNNLSFSVKKGETLGIIGQNGAGKSTLLKIITGVVTPTSGSIKVNGRIASLLELGAGFNPEMTGIENIYMNGTIMGYRKQEMDSRLDNIVSFADIGDFINRPVKMYSSGMFARLAFAVNAFVEPDILIVDEALAVGDIFFQNKCFKKFVDLRKKGVTILFVSHDLGSIRQLATKVIWLENGIIKMFGPTQSICTAYFNKQISKQNEQADLKLNTKNKSINISLEKNIVRFPILHIKGDQLLSEDVKIESIFLKDKNGDFVTQLEVEGEYTVSIVADFKKKMDNIIFGFVLENKKGIQILSINSFINSNAKLIQVSQIGCVCVNFKFILPKILKGEYIVSPAIARGVQHEYIMLTWITGAVNIGITNEGYNLSLLEIDANIDVKNYERKNIIFFDVK